MLLILDFWSSWRIPEMKALEAASLAGGMILDGILTVSWGMLVD